MGYKLTITSNNVRIMGIKLTIASYNVRIMGYNSQLRVIMSE